jgi:porin
MIINSNKSKERYMAMRFIRSFSTLSAGLLLCGPLAAYEINEQFAINATLKEIYQRGQFEIEGEQDDRGHALTGVDVELLFKPSEAGEFAALLRWAAGDALNTHWPGALSAFAHDGENDLINLNGSARDYLLTAYYTHLFQIAGENHLGLTLGLLDSTGWLDENAYAADELGQFMNDALVHNPVLNLPAYDTGAAASFEAGAWSLKGIVMRSKTGDDADQDFTYHGLQLGWKTETAQGEGNYRLIVYRTSKDFLVEEEQFDGLSGWGLSVDQSIGEHFGVFARYGRQSENVGVDYQAMASLGQSVKGGLWGRSDDHAGFG